MRNFANPNEVSLQDYGEMLIRSLLGEGYIRIDWHTPGALPDWGDVRLTLLGTDGGIELRKIVDVASRDDNDHQSGKDKLPYLIN